MSQSQVRISVAFFGANKESLLSIHQQRGLKRIASKRRGHKINIASTFPDSAFPPPAVANPFLHFRRESPFNHLGQAYQQQSQNSERLWLRCCSLVPPRQHQCAGSGGGDDNGITDPGIMLSAVKGHLFRAHIQAHC